MNKINYFLAILFMIFIFIFEFCFEISLSDIKGISLKNIVLYLMMLSLIVQKIFFRKDLFVHNELTFFILLYCVYYFVNISFKNLVLNKSLFSTDFLIYLKSSLDPLIVFTVLYSLSLKSSHLKKIIFFMTIIICIFNLLSLFSSFGLINFSNIYYNEKYGRVEGALHEPNADAACIAMFIPLLASYIFFYRHKFIQIFMVLNFVLAIFALMLTGSRGGFLAAITGLSCFYFLNQQQKKIRSILTFFSFATVACCIIFVVFLTLPADSQFGLENNVVLRYEEQDLDSYSSGRLGVWINCIEMYIENPLLGSPKTFSKVFGCNTHNTYLEVLFYQGIIGIFLYLAIFLFQYIYAKKYYLRNNYYIYSAYISCFISFFVSMCFLNMFSLYYFFFTLSAFVLKLGLVENSEVV